MEDWKAKNSQDTTEEQGGETPQISGTLGNLHALKQFAGLRQTQDGTELRSTPTPSGNLISFKSGFKGNGTGDYPFGKKWIWNSTQQYGKKIIST